MELIATLNDKRITSARVQIPAWGLWYADASVDGEVSLAGAVTLKIADLTLHGTVLSGGPQKGRSSFRIVAGAGGWGRTIPAKHYANDAGVKVAQILADAAAAAGETLNATTSEVAGPAFTRKEAPASRVLEQLAPHAWFVDELGVTRLGARPASTLTERAPRVTQVDQARATVTLAPESLAKLLPGVTVDGLVAVDVHHEITPKGVRTTIWGRQGAGSSRRLTALRALIEQLDPDRHFRAIWEYRVGTKEGNRWNLQPVRVSTGMPVLRRVPVRPGVAGADADLALGSRVLVAFVNADPTAPVVVAFEDVDGDGFAPNALTLVGEDDVVSALQTSGRVVRFGDTIMMPSGPAATPTPTVVTANPLAPASVSRVRA